MAGTGMEYDRAGRVTRMCALTLSGMVVDIVVQ